MADKFAGYSDSAFAPARAAFAVTKSDTTDYLTSGTLSKALYIGGAGDVAVIAADDSVAVTFVAVPAGTILPVRARKVMSTGTTATNIVGLA